MQALIIGPGSRAFSPELFPWLRYTVDAFRRLGHQTTGFVYREAWADSPALRQGLRRSPWMQRQLDRKKQADASRRDQRLLDLVRRLRPDLVLMLKGEVFGEALLDEIKHLSSGPLAAWWVDDPWKCPDHAGCLALYDHMFIFDRSYEQRLEQAGVKNVHFLPCACDETVYRPMQLSPGQRRRLKSEAALVSWYYPQRGELVRALATQAIDVGVWGGGWTSPQAKLALGGACVIRGSLVTDRLAAKIYNAAKIGLNIHHDQSRKGGLNTRTFELLASGLFQMVDSVPGLESLLTPGEEVVCYASAEEASRLAKFYLNDPAERRRIAAKGRERVLAEHTYVARMRRLCEIVRTCGKAPIERVFA